MNEEVKEATGLSTVIEELKSGKALSNQLGQVIEKRYIISEKKMTEWRDEFRINVPGDAGPSEVRRCAAEIASHYQDASFRKAAAEMKLTSLNSTRAREFDKALTNLVDKYKESEEKAPTKAVLESMANAQVKDYDAAILNAEMETIFWKSIIASLDNCRRNVEMINMSLGIEAKVINSDRFMSNGSTPEQDG